MLTKIFRNCSCASGKTYSTACAGFRIACNGSTVEPSEISANAKRFCFRTDRMNPLILTSWSSNLQVPVLLDWRICAHRWIEARGLIDLLSLFTDVAKLRRHICIAEGGRSAWRGDQRRVGKLSALSALSALSGRLIGINLLEGLRTLVLQKLLKSYFFLFDSILLINLLDDPVSGV